MLARKLCQAGADSERDREVRFAGAGRSEEGHVLARVKEVELAEMLDQAQVISRDRSAVREGQSHSCGLSGPPRRHDLAACIEVEALGPIHVGITEQ